MSLHQVYCKETGRLLGSLRLPEPPRAAILFAPIQPKAVFDDGTLDYGKLLVEDPLRSVRLKVVEPGRTDTALLAPYDSDMASVHGFVPEP